MRYDHPQFTPEIDMARRAQRQNGVRAGIAAAAARIMAEDGIDDFALAKRKAARRMGVAEGSSLPNNDEIAEALAAYRAIYQADEHPDRIRKLRERALGAMREFERFRPYLTGAVLNGSAGHYAEIELQLFPESAKEVELFLLDRKLAYDSSETRRYSGDRVRPATILSLDWEGIPLRLTVHDPRDEREALKTSQLGKVIERVGIQELGALIARAGA